MAGSVSMMRWGGRQDTLDDFCNFSNCKKTVDLGKAALVCLCLLISGLGGSLFKKLSATLPDCIIHYHALNAFTQGLKAEHNDVVDVCSGINQNLVLMSSAKARP